MKNINLIPTLSSLLFAGALLLITGCNEAHQQEQKQKQEQEQEQEQGNVLGTVTAKIETKTGDIIDYEGIIVDNIVYNTAANWEEIKGESSVVLVKSYMKKEDIEYNLNMILNLTGDNPIGTYYGQNESNEDTDTGFSTLSFTLDDGDTKQYGSTAWSDNKDLSGSMGNATVNVSTLTHQEFKATFSGLLKETFASGKDNQGILKVTEGTVDTKITYRLLK